MYEKIESLKSELDKHFRSAGEDVEWGRSINPAGEVLFILQKEVRVVVLDSAIEDNSAQAVLEGVVRFMDEHRNPKGHWILGSTLKVNRDLP